MRRPRQTLSLALLALCWAITSAANAQGNDGPPRTIAYEGTLTNALGEPLHCPTAGTCTPGVVIEFALYETATGGTAVWNESFTNVPVVNGRLGLTLGASSTLPADVFGQDVFLAVRLNGGDELAPRQRVSATMFALRAVSSNLAGDAAKLGGIDASEYPTAAEVPALADISGLAIEPSSVTIQGTSTALTAGSLDLGSDADDVLTAAMVKTLTGGGNADALHTHAGQGGGAGSGLSFPAPTMFSGRGTTPMDYVSALAYCRDLEEGSHTDWRLPTEAEFEYLLMLDGVTLPDLGTVTAEFWARGDSRATGNLYRPTFVFSGSWTAVNYFAQAYQYAPSATGPFPLCVR